jgi:hypothetical protein
MLRIQDERVKQVAIAAGILMTLMVVVTGLLLGWRYLPGLFGEWVGTMMGMLTTPFIMETSFIILGFVTVILINHWRQQRDGDELVYLEQVTGPDVPADLPDQAKWAVYREKPLEMNGPSLLTQAEGAVAIGDFQAAAEWIGAMGPDELKQLETLELRLELALATGRTDLAAQLEREIRSKDV